MAIETLLDLARRAGVTDMPVLKQQAMGGSGAYDAASRGRRGAGWNATRLGPNTLHTQASDTIVSRSRDAVRNSGWGASAIDSWVSNVIGPHGMRMIPKHDNEKARADISRVWKRWCEQCDSEYQVDVPGSGLMDFGSIQQLAAREVYEAGEVFVRIHVRAKSERLMVPIQLQLLETEQLPSYRFTSTGQIPAGNTIRMGIEYNDMDRRVAYHFYKCHPGETMFFNSGGLETERIPAKFIIPVYQLLRAGEMRGIPKLTPVLAKLNEIEKLTDAELVRKATCSMITGIITKTGPDSPFIADAAVQPTDVNTAITNLQPGTLMELLPGENINMLAPPDDGNFSITLVSFLKAFCAGSGVPYHQVTGDLSETSYSSIRAGLVEFRLRAEAYQRSVFEQRLLQPVFETFLKYGALNGAFVLPGFEVDPSPYQQAHWQPAGWAWVDPLKDIQATQLEIQMGLNTREAAAAELGRDAEQIDKVRAREIAREKELGLKYATEPQTATPYAPKGAEKETPESESGSATPKSGQNKPQIVKRTAQ